MALFHQLHPDPVILDQAVWESFLQNHHNAELEAELRYKRLIVENSQDDDEELRMNVDRAMQKLVEPKVLYLMLAQDCNFRCTYCPIPGTAERLGKIRLKAEDAVAGLRMWARHLMDGSGEDSYIIFYGGEPLLNVDVLECALDEIRVMRDSGIFSDSVHLMLVTNGSLVGDRVIDLFVKHGVHVTVGLDGFRDQHDRGRRYDGGGDTFDEVLSAMVKLTGAGVQVSVSTTVSEELARDLESYEAWLHELRVDGYGVNLPKGSELARRPVVDALVDRMRRIGGDGFEFQSSKKYLSFANADPYPTDCTCYGNQLVIRPNGTVSNCPFTEHQFGHVTELGEEFRIWDAALVRRWRNRSPAVHPLFEAFDAKSLSGTGCAFDALTLHGSDMAVDGSGMAFADAVLDVLIWKSQDKEE